MMAEARSLDWAAQEMANALNRRNIDPSQGYVVPLGYLLSSVVLQALAAETALKALQMLKLGYFIHGHDLNRRNIDPSQGYVVPLGYLLSSVVLQALAAETALKALQMLCSLVR